MSARSFSLSQRNYLWAAAALGFSALSLLIPALIPLVPALVALGLVFSTRAAVLSLATACLSAILLLQFHPEGARLEGWAFPEEGTRLGALLGPWHLGALIFTLLLGAFAAVIERGGGLLSLIKVDSRDPQAKRRFLTSIFGLGLVCFFDGLANAIMLGRVTRPFGDLLRVPRALLAYLVDTTSSAVACLAFLSTWIVTQLSYISKWSPLEEPAYQLFLRSLPYNFYCIFSLWLAFLVVRKNWLIGPMRTRLPSEEGDLSTPGPLASSPLRVALIPLGVLLLALPLVTLILFSPAESLNLGDHLKAALNSNAVPQSFMIASGLALIAAIMMFPRRKDEACQAALSGAKQLLPALLLLLLAWVLGSLFGALGTVKALSDALRESLPLTVLPAVVFALGCVVSFVSGTSWGTMGILMPIVLPTAGALATSQSASPETLAFVLPAVIGAVFGGAVFGDHCSPYSDTTIVSAMACGVTTHEHTITQLPYALLAAGCALVAGYLPVALGMPGAIGLLLGGGLLCGLVHWSSRRRTVPGG